MAALIPMGNIGYQIVAIVNWLTSGNTLVTVGTSFTVIMADPLITALVALQQQNRNITVLLGLYDTDIYRYSLVT
jgi:hypothetical protein